MIKEIKKLNNKVKELLFRSKKSRDNDNLLIALTWLEQNPRLKEEDYSFKQFARDFIDGKYASTEAVTRCRRKLQEKHELLRGNKYYERRNLCEQVKEEINHI